MEYLQHHQQLLQQGQQPASKLAIMPILGLLKWILTATAAAGAAFVQIRFSSKFPLARPENLRQPTDC
jgi:hypothetical protein